MNIALLWSQGLLSIIVGSPCSLRKKKRDTQCLTLTFKDTRHWASEFDKSVAHKDKPLVQEKLRLFET